jgi:rSAM/selenodomain-associated transferase 2
MIHKLQKISIIIPVFNEAEIIENTLLTLITNQDLEIIVVDGGSSDRTVELAQNLQVRVIIADTPGRANQMNLGAAIATGDILLFLHADTLLPENSPEIVRQILLGTDVVAGAFGLKIDGSQPSLRVVETMVNWRSRSCSLPYGDQAIFLKKDTFQAMDGFSNLPIMEDFELIQRLKRVGKIQIASVAVITSSRRWQKLGVLKTTLINQLIVIGYYLRFSPHQLKRLYHNK